MAWGRKHTAAQKPAWSQDDYHAAFASKIKEQIEQGVGLGLRQRGNVEIVENAAGVEIAGQKRVRHLPEEVAGGVVARHV